MLQGGHNSSSERAKGFTILVLNNADLEILQAQASSIRNAALSRCVEKAMHISAQKEMQFFDFQEVDEVEILGTDTDSASLILFANYIRKLGDVPQIIDPKAITYQEVSLRDFCLVRRCTKPTIITDIPSPPQTSPSIQDFFTNGLRQMEETLMPKTVHRKQQQPKSPSHRSTERSLPYAISNISFGERLGECYSSPHRAERTTPENKMGILEKHIPILSRVDRDKMVKIVRSYYDRTLVNAVLAAHEWATGGCTMIRAVDVEYLLDEKRFEDTNIQLFAQYYKHLNEARQSIAGRPSLFQIIPLSAFYHLLPTKSPPPSTSTITPSSGTGNM